MSVFDRLGYTFDSTQFGSASTLVPGAANTLGTIANNTPGLNSWQLQDLEAGTSSTRTNYYYNRTDPYNTIMLNSAEGIYNNALEANDSITAAAAEACIIKIEAFQSHTDNISGVTVVSSATAPGLDTASMVGQQNMQLLTKTDGPQQNTVPILGSFTSLFIQNTLAEYSSLLSGDSTIYINSIVATTNANTNITTYSSNLSSLQAEGIVNDLNTVASGLQASITRDCTFFQNSIQTSREANFLMGFNQMGGTNSYLINNVVGTPSLVAKLNSTSS
jgi:hypothetical protein